MFVQLLRNACSVCCAIRAIIVQGLFDYCARLAIIAMFVQLSINACNVCSIIEQRFCSICAIIAQRLRNVCAIVVHWPSSATVWQCRRRPELYPRALCCECPRRRFSIFQWKSLLPLWCPECPWSETKWLATQLQKWSRMRQDPIRSLWLYLEHKTHERLMSEKRVMAPQNCIGGFPPTAPKVRPTLGA